MSIAELKMHHGVDAIGIVKNPNTGKLFGELVGTGLKVKVQGNIDFKAPIRFMYDSLEMMAEGCIVNVSDNLVTTL